MKPRSAHLVWSAIAVILSILWTGTAMARGPKKGGGSDGGTKWSAEQFTKLATYLVQPGVGGISDLDRRNITYGLQLLMHNEGDLCDRPIRQRKGICAVETIIDPTSGRPLGDDYEIFGSSDPALIQIREKNCRSVTFQSRLEQGLGVAHIVFHELYRASGQRDSLGGASDDTWQLSQTHLRLHQLVFPAGLISLPPKGADICAAPANTGAGGGLSSWSVEKLRDASTKCNRSLFALAAAKMRMQGEMMTAVKFGPHAGFNAQDSDDVRKAIAKGLDGVGATLEGGEPAAFCNAIDKALERKGSR